MLGGNRTRIVSFSVVDDICPEAPVEPHPAIWLFSFVIVVYICMFKLCLREKRGKVGVYLKGLGKYSNNECAG